MSQNQQNKIQQKAHARWVARNPPESLLFFISYKPMLSKSSFSPLKWVHLLTKTMYSTYCRLSFAYSNNNYCCSWWNIPHQAKGCTLASSRRHITTSSFKTDAQHFITRRKCAAITPTSTRSTRKCPSRFKSSAEHIFDYGDARIGSQTAGVNARKREKSGSLSLVNTPFLYYPRPASSIPRGIP